MKNIYVTLILIAFSILMIACEKEKKENLREEDLSKFKVFKIFVKQLNNGQAVNNYELYFRMLKFYHISGSTQGVIWNNTVLYTIKTNADGNATFKIPKEILFKDSDKNIHKSYYIGGLENLIDSIGERNSNWNFKAPPEPINVYFDSTQLKSDIKFELISHLICPAEIILEDNISNFPFLDSLMFSSNIVPYYKLTMNEIYGIDKIGWAIDCNKSNKLTYYYRLGAYKSKEYSIQIEPSSSQFVLSFK